MSAYAMALARYEKAIDRLSLLMDLKDIGDEAGAFGSDLDALVTRAYRGRMNVAAFAAQMDALLAQYIRASYIEGLAEGGIDESEIDRADEQVIRDTTAAQREYVDGFAQAVMNAKQESDLRAQIDNRIVMWGKSIRAAAVAGVNSAAANEVVIFSGQMGKEDCPTCHGLMGARHRRSWFVERNLVPGIPGNLSFECGSWNCEHFLAPVGAPLRGRAS